MTRYSHLTDHELERLVYSRPDDIDALREAALRWVKKIKFYQGAL